ncbi:MAG TPA: ATP synthase F1 subunit delta [Thermoanaerobaculia bacterium]|jgi:F-type H+-transporting ATPase subunit delta|nr:ATP synthase F1 subunit delta [Thermoanaerobaculia bacterium]
MKRIARPYAKAVLAVAGSLERATAVRDELGAFATAFASALGPFFANPAVPLLAKRSALDKVTERLGLAPLTRRLLQALLSRHRLGRLDEVVAGLTDELNRRQGIAVAELTTAEPLEDDERGELQRVLEAKIGKKLQLREQVDPDLLAGFVARVDSQLFDGSLRGQLDRLARELAEA